ncbi:MAG: glycerophosphodiester phosphodiesterase [Clostridia bacterium]|nr:glycerophosphodiester phosphodiesterase [Clostridia bacterium]
MDLFNSWLVHKYIAHRGLHTETIPENSVGAILNAIDHDYAIEFDIHPLEDGTPVVFHDETLKRLTGEDGYIKKVSNVEELKKLNLFNAKGEKTNEKIPTLKEALKIINGQVPVVIEIKDYNLNSNFEKTVYEILKEYTGEYAIMSFNPYTLKWFKNNAPEVTRGQLSCYFKDQKLGKFKTFVLKRMMLNKTVSAPHFIAYKYDEVPNKYVKKYKHLPLLCWAVPSQQDYMKVAGHCDNIIFEHFEPRI